MGRRMIEYSHSSIKRFSLELGGDAPVLIFADTKDIKSAIADMVGLKFANGGQICVSPNRVYVQREIYPMVLEECKKLAAKYSFGSGEDHSPKEEVLQPVVSEQALTRYTYLVRDSNLPIHDFFIEIFFSIAFSGLKSSNLFSRRGIKMHFTA